MPNILVINAGSATIKYQLIAMPRGERLVRGLVDGIGRAGVKVRQWRANGSSTERVLSIPDHRTGVTAVFETLGEGTHLAEDAQLAAIGHRVVHGGENFRCPTPIDDAVIERLEAVRHLAPLHNSASLAGIRVAREMRPDLPQVAVFDTVFHHGLPAAARHYALELALQREQGIRRYGFHGLSHRYVASAAASWLDRPLSDLKMITLHLGNGASACAIRGGCSVDTSMGFTPLEGLVMGTRCGDLDPALPGHLVGALGLSAQEVDNLLNHRSGLHGLCGDSDMRRIEERVAAGDADARLAFDVFCYRVRKYVGAYYAVLNGLDALVFTGGIGEHSCAVRAAVCEGMDALGIAVDPARNRAAGDRVVTISPRGARLKVLVAPTDEELEIARDTQGFL